MQPTDHPGFVFSLVMFCQASLRARFRGVCLQSGLRTNYQQVTDLANQRTFYHKSSLIALSVLYVQDYCPAA